MQNERLDENLIKSKFKDGDKPTGKDFSDLIDYTRAVTWDEVEGKPSAYPTESHTHDDRYYTETEIDTKLASLGGGGASDGKVKLDVNDTSDYLGAKLDGVTVVVENKKVVVKKLDGLTIGTTDINNYLSGTSSNIQNQINTVNNLLTTIASGMEYKGMYNSHAELLQVSSPKNAWLAVVLVDESNSGQRSLYIYDANKSVWSYIGTFTFSSKFIQLEDTPNNWSDSNGKVLKADEANNKLIFSNVDWSEISNKPTSTIVQIDDAVTKRHSHTNKALLDTYDQTNADLIDAVTKKHAHTNKAELDRLSISGNNYVLVDGKSVVPPVNFTVSTDTPIADFPMGETITLVPSIPTDPLYIAVRKAFYDIMGYTDKTANVANYRYYMRTIKSNVSIMRQEISVIANNNSALGFEAFIMNRETTYSSGNALSDWRIVGHTLVGSGSPEGKIGGWRGWSYLDKDNGKRYYKATPTDEPNFLGWVEEGSKEYLYAGIMDDTKLYSSGAFVNFDTKHSGTIPLSSPDGKFTLTAGKTYRITLNTVLTDVTGFASMFLTDVGSAGTGLHNLDMYPPKSDYNSATSGTYDAIFTPTATKGYTFRQSIANGASTFKFAKNRTSLIIQEL